MALSKKKVLITVKAYPNPSSTLGEAACIAGISDEKKWVRLYPIPFRDLDESQRFKKYQWVEVTYEANKKKTDPRPETIRPITESIKILGEELSTDREWKARKEVVLPLLQPSMCTIQEAQTQNGTSLGVFRPREVLEVVAAPESTPDWTDEQLANRYRCHDCRTKEPHQMKILDWELAELWRGYRRGHSEEATIRAVQTKYFDELCGPKKDPLFFTGNMQAHPQTFLILGVFWPPRVTQGDLFPGT